MSTAQLFTDLAVITAIALLGPLLSGVRRLAIPAVIGELIGGALIGNTGIRLIDPSSGSFPAFYALGFAMLMLEAGSQVDIRSPALRRSLARGSVTFAVVVLLSLGAGLLISAALDFHHAELIFVLLAGSSAAVAYPIIEEERLTGAAVEYVMAWIAVADSVTSVVMPITLLGAGSIVAAVAGDAVIAAIGFAVVLLATRVVHRPWVVDVRRQSVVRGWGLEIRISVLMLLALSAIAARAGASALFAGFVAGMILTRFRITERLPVQMSGLAAGFFVPLFFVLLGARLDLRALFTDPHAVALAVILAVAATLIHVAGALVMGISPRRWIAGLAASAQLGLPAAAASLTLAGHLLSPANAAALVAGGCLTMIPATVGSRLLTGK